jgi:hypothetical protein
MDDSASGDQLNRMGESGLSEETTSLSARTGLARLLSSDSFSISKQELQASLDTDYWDQ